MTRDHAVATGPRTAPERQGSQQRRPRIAYLSFSSGRYDARSFRMARSAVAAGYEVTVYARSDPELGDPAVEEHEGYRLIRVPADWRMAIPGVRRVVSRRAWAAMREAPLPSDRLRSQYGPGDPTDPGGPTRALATLQRQSRATPRRGARRLEAIAVKIVKFAVRYGRRLVRRVVRSLRKWRHVLVLFPLRPLGWAWALESVAEPADVWHGMWAGSLPALARMQARHGGRTIYDSRDVYMRSRSFSRLGWPLRSTLVALERRWARAADRVLTVNEPYADLLVDQLGIPRPLVVMNCPETWTPGDPRPDLIRAALGLSAGTKVVLYQGQLISERGIEQAMDAILQVPGAVLVLLGFGAWQERYEALAGRPPYRGHVMLLPAVPPSALLAWTASADVTVMPIQPTTENHRFTTPQKLFESIAAGVPVVVSDLPGMAPIVRETGVGLACDPSSPGAIAASIRQLMSPPEADRTALRGRVLQVAHERYNWEAQSGTLLALYDELAPVAARAGDASGPGGSA
jgi:glycosyltransferase involved in cell wall biosynthesis